MCEQNVKQLAKEGFYMRDVADTLSLLSASGKLNPLLYITKLTYSLTTDRRLRNKHNRTATHGLKALEYTLQLPENECLSLTFPMRKLASRVDCIYTLSDIQWLCNLPDLQHFLREYWHSQGAYALANTDISHLIQYPTHLFQALNIPVKSFQEDPTAWDIHKVRCTGPHGFRD